MSRPTHVLVDRDGVLNREHDGRVVASAADWEWERGAVDGLARLAAAGVAVSIVTNQSAVGRGSLTAAALGDLHRWLAADLVARGVRLVGVFSCPHAPDEGCVCRKPAPGLLLDALRAAGATPEESVLVGDATRDLDAATAAGVDAVLVRTGKGARSAAERPGTPVHDDLDAAVRSLLSARR